MRQRTVGPHRNTRELRCPGSCGGDEGELGLRGKCIANFLMRTTQDVFRKYPSTYEGVIPTLCANLEELDEPEAKASLIWIIGEYAEKIDNADELLSTFVDTFTEESYQVCMACEPVMGVITEALYQVQLQTLTAVVKLFLKKPDSSQGVVQRVLDTATKDCDSPDVRDRAYIYWRLLSTDPGAAKVRLSKRCLLN
jgi:AP-1 complex subunit beta-1